MDGLVALRGRSVSTVPGVTKEATYSPSHDDRLRPLTLQDLLEIHSRRKPMICTAAARNRNSTVGMIKQIPTYAIISTHTSHVS